MIKKKQLDQTLTFLHLSSSVSSIYSKTPIYRGVWGQGNIRDKSGSAVNRGFVWLTLCMFSPIWGKGNGRGISGFAVITFVRAPIPPLYRSYRQCNGTCLLFLVHIPQKLQYCYLVIESVMIILYTNIQQQVENMHVCCIPEGTQHPRKNPTSQKKPNIREGTQHPRRNPTSQKQPNIPEGT